MKTRLFIAGLAIVAITALAYGQNNTTGQCKGKGNGQCAMAGKQKCDGKPANSSVCKKDSTKKFGANFVDKNKNDICDHHEAKAK